MSIGHNNNKVESVDELFSSWNKPCNRCCDRDRVRKMVDGLMKKYGWSIEEVLELINGPTKKIESRNIHDDRGTWLDRHMVEESACRSNVIDLNERRKDRKTYSFESSTQLPSACTCGHHEGDHIGYDVCVIEHCDCRKWSSY